MTKTPSDFSRRRLAIFAFMLMFGIGMASWVVRTPAVRDLLAASTAEMGLVLVGLSVGSMTGVLSSAAVVRRQGVRFTATVGGSSFIAGIAMLGICAGMSNFPGVFAGLALVGFGIGVSEIAINIEGAALETLSGKSVMPALHGCFSLGTVIGAVVGILLTSINFSVTWQLVLVALFGVGVLATLTRFISAETGRVPRLARGEKTEKHSNRARPGSTPGANHASSCSGSSSWRWRSPKDPPWTGCPYSWLTATASRPRSAQSSSPDSRQP